MNENEKYYPGWHPPSSTPVPACLCPTCKDLLAEKVNENELLARWLGWEFVGHHWHISGECGPDRLPDFRTSNEWAGALLEKLTMGIGCSLHSGPPGVFLGITFWFPQGGSDIYNTERHTNWRDAVVDGALEVIRRSGNGQGE